MDQLLKITVIVEGRFGGAETSFTASDYDAPPEDQVKAQIHSAAARLARQITTELSDKYGKEEK